MLIFGKTFGREFFFPTLKANIFISRPNRGQKHKRRNNMHNKHLTFVFKIKNQNLDILGDIGFFEFFEKLKNFKA